MNVLVPGHAPGPYQGPDHGPDRAVKSLNIRVVIGLANGIETRMEMGNQFLSSFPPPPPLLSMKILNLSLNLLVHLSLWLAFAPVLCPDLDLDHDPYPDHDPCFCLWQGHQNRLQDVSPPGQVVLPCVLLVVWGQAQTL